ERRPRPRRHAPARLEDDAEDEGEDGEIEQRLRHRPDEAEQRAAIAPLDLAAGEPDGERAPARGGADRPRRLPAGAHRTSRRSTRRASPEPRRSTRSTWRPAKGIRRSR